MLLARIQQDLFDFTERDPEDFPGLVEFWYRANSEVLSAALTAHQGLNFILNVKSFNQIDAALSDVEKTVRRINQSRALRKQGILAGLLGLNADAFIGVPEATLVTGLVAGTAAMVAEHHDAAWPFRASSAAAWPAKRGPSVTPGANARSSQ